LQAGPGTQGSALTAPPIASACGSEQGGGSTGVVNAGAGGLTSGQFCKQLPKPLKQPQQQQPSPAEPGNANDVVVGSG